MLQTYAQIYLSYGVLPDDVHRCLEKLERHLFVERLQQALRQNLQLPEKDLSQLENKSRNEKIVILF